jgi:colicin import membrane protein
MPAAAERLEFAPPPQPGLVRAFVLAIIAHVLLMLALTWGINWNRESENVAAEAELWASVPQQAAPREVPAPPPPPPVQQVAPTPPPPPAPREADIALEREKLKKEEALRKQEEQERQRKIEEARKKREELEREKKLEARKKEEELRKKQLAEQKAAEELKKKKAEELAKAKAREEEAKLAELRKENLERMMKGATGGPTATGTALRSAGPSDSYAGRVRARVRPNIVFADDVSGNPMAAVEVRLAPDGTITSRRLMKSSGVKSWDEAVLRALDKTEVLPKDVDGRVHSPLTIEFKPKG